MICDLGIVIPVYRSKESVKKLIHELEQLFLPEIRIRICLVDDSNDENVAGYLKQYCLTENVKLVVLNGNFGQQAAILCGLRRIGPCRFYATIDDDLEQPPRILYRLYQQVVCGCDLAYGIPVFDSNKRRGYRRWGSRMRDVMFSRLLGVPDRLRVSSLRVMKASVVSMAIKYHDSRPGSGFFYLSAAVFKSAGKKGRKLKVKNLCYQPSQRYQGKSGYSISRLLRLYGKILWHYGFGLSFPGIKKKDYRIEYETE